MSDMKEKAMDEGGTLVFVGGTVRIGT